MQSISVVAAVNNQAEKEYLSHHAGENHSDEFKKLLDEQKKKFVKKEEHHEELHEQEETKMEKMNFYTRNAIEGSFYMATTSKDYKC